MLSQHAQVLHRAKEEVIIQDSRKICVKGMLILSDPQRKPHS